MKYVVTLIFLCMFLSCDNSNDSDDKDEKEIVVNAPPSNQDYYLGGKESADGTQTKLVWTTNFSTFTELTNEFWSVLSAKKAGNQLVLVVQHESGQNAVAFARLNDFKNFSTVSLIV